MAGASGDRRFYRWRKMSDEERRSTLKDRRRLNRPWHSPPHIDGDSGLYLVTGTCFEHEPVIGESASRMAEFSKLLCETFDSAEMAHFAWVVLPNHYHSVVKARDAKSLIGSLGKMHGRSSYLWNGEDDRRGRQVWFNAVERSIRSERHFWASLIYVFNNPVKHGYVDRWQEWPNGNAVEWLESVGREEAVKIWREYPIDDYGSDWDSPDL